MSDYDFLWSNAQAARAVGEGEVRHLASRVAILDYIRIADEIAAQTRGSILDWGCGYGQMSFLLRQRGLQVTSYDVGHPAYAERLPLTREITPVVGGDPVLLPFASRDFNAVLSCGVLEHVPDQDRSLEEIRRVLRPRGHFFIYNLPNAYSYKEFLIGRFQLGYTHERKYTVGTIRRLLARHGLKLICSRRGGMLPHTLTGAPAGWQVAYDKLGRSVFFADRTLAHIPVLNALAESLEVAAEASEE